MPSSLVRIYAPALELKKVKKEKLGKYVWENEDLKAKNIGRIKTDLKICFLVQETKCQTVEVEEQREARTEFKLKFQYKGYYTEAEKWKRKR